MKIHNLGVALSLIAMDEASSAFAYEDAHAFHAPSECYPIIERGLAKTRRTTRRRIHALTGVKAHIVLREARRRLGHKGLERALDRAASRIQLRWWVGRHV